MKFIPTERPYWHVDAKWISGLVLMVTLAAALLLNSLAVITAPKNGVEFSATIIATLFSREGLDAEGDIEEVRQKVNAAPNGVYTPIPNFPNVQVTREDVQNLSPRELRLKIFRQVAEPIYTKGIEGAAAEVTNDPEQIEKFKRDAFFLSAFTQQTHNSLAAGARVAGVVALIALAAVVFFSWGWGRAANPGALMLLVALPGTLISLLAKHPPTDGDGGPFGMIPPDLLPGIASALFSTYATVSAIGLILLLVAGAGRLATRHQKPKAV